MMRQWLQLVSWFNRKAKNVAIRLVKWTGKSKEPIHPKHLIGNDDHYWFLPHLKPDDTVLDLGCGSGAHSIEAAKKVRSIKGIDHNNRNLAIAKRLAAKKSLHNISFQEASLEKFISEPANAYQAVLALDVLEHLVKRGQLLKEIRRILADNGRLFLSVPNSETTWKKKLQSNQLFFYSDFDHKHEYTKTEIIELLQSHGYMVGHLEPTVIDTPWVGIIDLIGGISLGLYKRLSKWKRRMAILHPEEATGFRIIATKGVN